MEVTHDQTPVLDINIVASLCDVKDTATTDASCQGLRPLADFTGIAGIDHVIRRLFGPGCRDVCQRRSIWTLPAPPFTAVLGLEPESIRQELMRSSQSHLNTLQHSRATWAHAGCPSTASLVMSASDLVNRAAISVATVRR
jgi:hypothetical protein